MRVAAILLVVAILGVTGCSESVADSDPAPAVAHTPAPAAETEAASSDAGRPATAAPAQTAAPATPDPTATTTTATPEPTRASVVAVVVETASPATATREEDPEDDPKGASELTPRPPKPPPPQPTAAAAAVAGASTDSATTEKEEQPYIWYDGDRTMTVWLHTEDPEPVFRTSSGSLMTLPGGVLLKLDGSWDQTRVASFFAAHDIERSRVTEQSFGVNAFFVETEPGFASLDLANALAVQEGVLISSPNWRREVSTR